jgi:SAM-dependent methyltransferase
VLEVGVGLGTDFVNFVRAGAEATGVDLTEASVAAVGERLALEGLEADLRVADAESLPFADGEFDLVYSWGVIHHSPDTAAAVREIHRVLRPGGRARVMIYKHRSLVGAMLWLRYGLLAGRPLRPLRELYARHLESPGTKAYSCAEARGLFAGFASVAMRSELSPGDLLTGAAGQRHQGLLLSAARRVYPRGLVRRTLRGLGLFLLIEATRGASGSAS